MFIGFMSHSKYLSLRHWARDVISIATSREVMFISTSRGLCFSRAQPCVQAVQDKYRLVKYDMSANNLLKNRHNVIPGMFLIYSRCRLIFADLVFNGYGNAKKDFMKQVTTNFPMISIVLDGACC